jgi:putative resolvase
MSFNIQKPLFKEIIFLRNHCQPNKIMPIPDGYVSKKKTKEILNISDTTLNRWRIEGKIKFVRPGNNYYYDVKQICDDPSSKKNFIYARVSTRGQQNNLNNQIKYLQDLYPNHTCITDVASGINFKRKGF